MSFSDLNLFFVILFVAISCGTNGIRRVFYRFNYSSTDNTISSVEAIFLLQSSPPSTRITIEWNDIAVNPATNTTIPRRIFSLQILHVSDLI